jgi:hypothetical protein
MFLKSLSNIAECLHVEPGNTKEEHLSAAFKDSGLHSNIRISWKVPPGTNTL